MRRSSVLAVACLLLFVPSALAYDTGPHSELRLTMENGATATHQYFTGLAAGASETRPLSLSCFSWTATIDDLEQVAETDETNNTRGLEPVIC